jgi:hypothetical protein
MRLAVRSRPSVIILRSIALNDVHQHLRHVRDVIVCELGGKGSASVDAATRSVTGKSTGAKPPREPSATLAPRANAAVDDAVGEREVA